MDHQPTEDLLHKLIYTPIIDTFGIHYLTARPGRVEAELRPDARFGNHSNNMQGGVQGVYLDNVMGQACYTLLGEGQLLSTMDINLSFLEPVPLERLKCVTWVVKKGRRVIFAEGEIQNLAGKPLSRATATLLILRKVPDSGLPRHLIEPTSQQKRSHNT